MKRLKLSIATISFALCSSLLFGQIEHREFPVQGGYVECSIMNKNVKLSVNDTLMYAFLVGNQLKTLQGSYYGKLLHGHYLKTDPDGNVMVEGNYRKGLQHGKWKFWTGGLLDSAVTFSRGLRHGPTIYFYPHGSRNVEYRHGVQKTQKKISVKQRVNRRKRESGADFDPPKSSEKIDEDK